MDPAAIVGVVLGVRRRLRHADPRGRQPGVDPADPAAVPDLRRLGGRRAGVEHAARHARRHQVADLRDDGEEVRPRGRDRAPGQDGRAGAARGPARAGVRGRERRRPLHEARPADGGRRHRPRRPLRDPHRRGQGEEGVGQGGRELLDRRRRLLPHHRHHRHRRRPGPRAREPVRARASWATSSRARSSRPCGASCRANIMFLPFGQADRGRRDRRGRSHGARHRRRPGHPGRLQPARRRHQAPVEDAGPGPSTAKEAA